MRRGGDLAGWAVVAAMFAGYFALREPPPPRAEAGGARRLLGPLVELAVNVQWVRFGSALSSGRLERAIAHAETAIELDPSSPLSYDILAWQLAFDLASATRERDPARRRAWLEAGLAVAARGEERTDSPAEFAYLQGIILQVRAQTDPDIDWPGGVDGLWRDAEAHYVRAAELGNPEAPYAVEYVRTRDERDEPSGGRDHMGHSHTDH